MIIYKILKKVSVSPYWCGIRQKGNIQMAKFILGLDISTACTGVSIVYQDDAGVLKPVVVTHLRHKTPKNTDSIGVLFMKCDNFTDKLREILVSNGLYNESDGSTAITDVVIEEPLLGSNNQNTVAALLRYNGMVAYRVYGLLGLIPSFISSHNARMYGVPSLMAVRKYNKKGETYPRAKILKAVNSDELVLFGAYPFDCAKKHILWNYVSERFPDINWVYNKNGDLKNENFDASDSLICVLGYVNMLEYGGTKPSVVCVEATDTDIRYSYRFCGEDFNKTISLAE